jgi:TolA-binding protein
MEPRDAEIEEISGWLQEALAKEDRENGEISRARADVLDDFARNAARRPRPRRRSYRMVWPVAVSLSLAAYLYLYLRPVSFSIGESRSGRIGELIESPADQDTPLAFSEGSRLVLHEGGRLRVLALGPRAARVLVEDGTLDVSVVHAPGQRVEWSFEAGTFLVTVTGTKFRMTFSSRDQSFRLATQEGRVLVMAGCRPAPRSVSAGEQIEISCPRVGPSAEPAESWPPLGPFSTGPDEKEAHEEPPADDGRPPAGGGPSQSVPAWRGLLAAGRLFDGLQAAERANFHRVCKTATAKELLRIADAARLYGSSRRAMEALQALRRRFPDTADATTAAYRLGLTAFEMDEAYGQAARWFEIYLREQPTGPLMGDAFGRMMQARSRAGDRPGARESAEQYLHRFPKGPYAREARGILSK